MTSALNDCNNNDDKATGAVTSTPTATSATASGCPVLDRRSDAESSNERRPGLWNRWFSRSTNAGSNNPVITRPNDNPSVSSPMLAVSECPVKGTKSVPASIEEAANHSQIPHPGQRFPLSKQRVISSIPRGETDSDGDMAPSSTTPEKRDKTSVPAHQPADYPHWQYPSEQQFYNAMLKKGYRPPVESIPSVLQIHNAVNERSWSQVCRWEKELHDNEEPKLVKFVGRPKDLSPRAWWNSRVLMTQEPFDRHDWYVEDSEGGEPRRYVIDFYEGKEKAADLASTLASATRGGNGGEKEDNAGAATNNMLAMKPPSMYIDARPALDNPLAAVDRMTMFARETLPGIASVWDSYKTSPTTPSSDIAGCSDSNDGSGKQ